MLPVGLTVPVSPGLCSSITGGRAVGPVSPSWWASCGTTGSGLLSDTIIPDSGEYLFSKVEGVKIENKKIFLSFWYY